MMRSAGLLLVFVFLVPGIATSAHAQKDPGPMGAPPKFEVKRVPAEPHPGPPPVPESEIIQRMSANEDVMKKEYDSCNFKQSIRIEELDSPGGKYTVSGEIYTKPDGGRVFRIEKPAESDLKQSRFTLEDVKVMTALPLFVLTTEEIMHYNFKYAGQDKLDEINTYVFQVKPKQLSRTRRYFEGVVWVDDQTFTIVKSYGKFVSELTGNGTKLPFTMFETFRENFQDKFWLPTYTRSDDIIPEADGSELHLHLVIRNTDFHKIDGASAAASAMSPPTSANPAVPPSHPESVR